MNNKLAFLNQEAPAHYVAGLGRGATGFTTRSDIGPAAEGPDEETLQAAIAAQTAARQNAENGDDQDEDGRFQDPENETGLFANGPYDRDDEEADRAFDLIEDTMLMRRTKGSRYAFPPSFFGMSVTPAAEISDHIVERTGRVRMRRFVATRTARYCLPFDHNSRSSRGAWRA